MNTELLAADIVSRVPAMSQDSPINNVPLVKRLIDLEAARCARSRGSENQSWHEAYFGLWSHLSQEHGLTLLDSELDDIIDLAVRVRQFAIRDEEEREKYLNL